MRKKILGAVVLLTFLFSLGFVSNIQEVRDLPEQTAGTESLYSGYSFTPESDEETGIEKRNVIWVTSSYEEFSKETDIEDTDTETVTQTDTPEEQAAESETAEMVESTEVSAEIKGNRWGITLTEDEIDLLARIVWLESQGEPVTGQQAVVEVVFNRMCSGVYPATLYEVLSQENPVQFCSWKNRDRAQPTQKEYDSIYSVLNGETSILRNDTMYFSTFPLTEHVEVKIGGHYFCY